VVRTVDEHVRVDAEPHGTQEPMELKAKIPTMASFKGGEHSTDPRRCTAHSRQAGKRCKNAFAQPHTTIAEEETMD
jgi:hypothetical protein